MPTDWPPGVVWPAAIVRMATAEAAVVLVEPAAIELLDLDVRIVGELGVVVFEGPAAREQATGLADALNSDWKLAVRSAHSG